MSGHSSVAALLPALNEAPRIGAVLDGLRAVLPTADIVVVDDGSSDGTAGVARSYATVLRHAFPLGYGAALQTGYKYLVIAGYERCVQLDADGQHDPATLPALLRALDDAAANVAIGSRRLVGTPAALGVRDIGAHCLRWLSRTLGGFDVTDPTSGLRALDGSALRILARLDLPEDYPELEVLISLRKAGLRVVEVPARAYPRTSGRSMHSGLRPLYYAYKVTLAGAFAALRARRTHVER